MRRVSRVPASAASGGEVPPGGGVRARRSSWSVGTVMTLGAGSKQVFPAPPKSVVVSGGSHRARTAPSGARISIVMPGAPPSTSRRGVTRQLPARGIGSARTTVPALSPREAAPVRWSASARPEPAGEAHESVTQIGSAHAFPVCASGGHSFSASKRHASAPGRQALRSRPGLEVARRDVASARGLREGLRRVGDEAVHPGRGATEAFVEQAVVVVARGAAPRSCRSVFRPARAPALRGRRRRDRGRG